MAEDGSLNKRLIFLTIHGMGEQTESYAHPIWALLQRGLRAQWSDVAARAIYYKRVLQRNEEAVWDKMCSGAPLRWQRLRKLMLFGLADAAGIENRKEESDSVYERTQALIATALWEARAECGREALPPVAVLAQSLGGQVLSSYIWDAQQATLHNRPAHVGIWRDIDRFARDYLEVEQLTREDKCFLGLHSLQALFTTGCNIPIFIAAHQSMSIRPITKPHPSFEWHNYYDVDDVLGWPLQPLGAGYEQLVQDHAITAGQGWWGRLLSLTPLSHAFYWSDPDLVEPLVKALERLLRQPCPPR